MRDIHPSYLTAHVVCACGASYVTRSTRGNFTVDVCANCHPFYTGKQKLMDTAGRVDRFRKKFGEVKASRSAKDAPKAPGTKAAAPKAEKAEKAEKAAVKPAEKAE